MTEQKEHYDPYIARYRAFLEQHGLTPPDLKDHIAKHQILYLSCRIIYAIEDTLSFLFGNIKLYFSLIASYHQRSDAGAADDLHTSLQSFPDLLIILALGIPLAIIQVLGVYFADSKDLKTNKIKYFFAKILAPYLRDILQGIKWAYKAMNTVLKTIFNFMPQHKDLILKILFPLSIAIAVVSLLNRIFLRTLRNFRKARQSANRKTSLETIEEGLMLKFRDSMPSEKKELRKLRKSLVYVQNGDGFDLFYVDDAAAYKQIILPQNKQSEIFLKIQSYQSANICNRVKREFIRTDNTGPKIKELHFVDAIPENLSMYRNSLLFLISNQIDTSKRLIYVNDKGRSEYHEASEYFTQAVANELKNKTSLILHPLQLEDITRKICDAAELDFNTAVGLPYDEWRIASNAKKKQDLPGSLIYFCYASVVLSAIIDGAYFYMGVAFIASFNPAGFIAMLAMAGIMMAVCLVGRVYEEYCYQKAFNISQIEIDLAIQKTELNILTKAIESLLATTNHASLPELLIKFRSGLIEYDKQQRTLESQIRISASEAFLRGLRNGLSTQGVISALMFVGVTIMTLTGTACPPLFVIIMMSISFLVLARSVYRYMQSYYEYKKHDTPLQELKLESIDLAAACKDAASIESLYKEFISKKAELDDRTIAMPPDLKEEENSEVVRVGCTGFTKWQKNFGECTLGAPRHGEEWWLTLTSLLIGVSMLGVFGVRGVHKMYSGQDDGPNTVDTTDVKTAITNRLPNKTISSRVGSSFVITTEDRGSPMKKSDSGSSVFSSANANANDNSSNTSSCAISF